MNLTLAEAAQYLGKSPRQVRYMLKRGELTARKVEGRWVIDEATLPVSDARRQARARKAGELAATVDDALRPHLRPGGRRFYTVVDLQAFRHGVAAARAAVERLGDVAPAAGALRASLVAVAQACHAFHQREKASAFGLARDRAAEAVALLHLDGGEPARALADVVEQDYLVALAGLLRREDNRGRA